MYSNMLAEVCNGELSLSCKAHIEAICQKLKKRLQEFKDSMANWPAQLFVPIIWSYVKIANEYLGSSEGKRVAYQITAVNGFVWFLWQLKALRPFMLSTFTHHPLSGRYITLLTSVFRYDTVKFSACNH